ncbi:MAG: 4Fe-4S binding protein [Candidatus Helarchaeota archaeon]|nr:4Fe-4S binding protein [Candidatus Helarchaeota archaeon]
MSDEPYFRLREYLDRFPIGFPKTSSGIEIKILKKLFTEEEAKIAVNLTPIPTEAVKIAKRIKMDENELKEKLESMSKKGLIFRLKRKGKTLYNPAPFMIGLYEYSVKKIDKELAKLYKEYYDTAYMDEMGASNVPGFKVLPVDETIEANTTLYPFHKLKESIKEARKIAVTECICRKESRLTGEPCNYPIETCLSFGAAAFYYIENGMGREVDAEEAIRIIEEADKSGLIHAGANAKHLSNICNCCPCCCASMKGITKMGYDKKKYLNAIFESIIDKEKCIACETCVDRCPVGAIEMEEIAVVNRDKCLGCGLCASVCPEEAITLKLREDGEEPFDRVIELGMAIFAGKKKRSK